MSSAVGRERLEALFRGFCTLRALLPTAVKNPASLSRTRISEPGHAREGARPRWAPPPSLRPTGARTSPSRQPTLSRVPASTISHARPLARIHPRIVIIHDSTSPLAVADGIVVVPPKGEPCALRMGRARGAATIAWGLTRGLLVGRRQARAAPPPTAATAAPRLLGGHLFHKGRHLPRRPPQRAPAQPAPPVATSLVLCGVALRAHAASPKAGLGRGATRPRLARSAAPAAHPRRWWWLFP